MSSMVQLTGGAFQDPSGNPLANGFLLMSLSQDGQVNGGSQLAAGRELKITLDGNGNIATNPAQYVWPNDVISPANTFYNVSAYTGAGQLVWGPNAQQVFSSPSPYNVGAWIPGVTSVSAQPVTTYDIGVFFPGMPNASEIILLLPIERGVRFAANLAPSLASCGTNATASAVFTLSKNGTQFGTITFNPGSSIGVIASTNGVTFGAGDVLTITAPSSSDSTLQNIGILLSGVVIS